MGTPLKNQNFEKRFFCMLERTKKWAQNQIVMSLSPQMAEICLNNQMANFHTGQFGDPPLKKNKTARHQNGHKEGHHCGEKQSVAASPKDESILQVEKTQPTTITKSRSLGPT